MCYRCDDQEYWDSNSGKNYVVVKKSSGHHHSDPMPIPSHQARRFLDATSAKLDSWSEFASWNHLTNDSPYW